jgi:uncharacterized protein (DUF983 family)
MPEPNQTPELAPVPVTGLPVPQFSTAEYAHIPGTERCRVCGNFISGEYYRANGQMVCSVCGFQLRSGQPADSHAAFVRGLALGIGAAIVGLVVYSAFTIITHIYLGYLAVGVGWLIGKAIMKGSNGIGGRHYQITAVALTYFSISLAEVPIFISAVMHNPKFHISVGRLIAVAWPTLLWRGLASPFLNLAQPFQGALGLLILFVGIRFAWQFTAARALPIDGPFPVNAG